MAREKSIRIRVTQQEHDEMMQAYQLQKFASVSDYVRSLAQRDALSQQHQPRT
jgi:Arc/MetJ-type ribon-helix-helix transcriptional regulator